jgi:hypothetical protein
LLLRQIHAREAFTGKLHELTNQRDERSPVARVDSTILHEIAHIIQARGKVPEHVQVQKREYQITYLDDHRQRIEEALRRHDTDRLNMLFGQLASKVKYQLLRRVAAPESPKTTQRRKARSPQRKQAKAR